jgi:hypothetical protein
MSSKNIIYCVFILIMSGCISNATLPSTEISTLERIISLPSRFTETQIATQTIPIKRVTPTSTFTRTSITITEPYITATHIIKHNEGIYFEDKECGITFEYPINWKIQPIPSEDKYLRCRYGINPPGYSKTVEESEIELEEYAIYLGGVNAGFYEAARKMGFGFDDNGWFAYGRQNSKGPAELIKDGNRYLLLGSNDFGTFWKNRPGYAGLAEMDSAVIYVKGNVSAYLYDSISTYKDCFEYILHTIRI